MKPIYAIIVFFIVLLSCQRNSILDPSATPIVDLSDASTNGNGIDVTEYKDWFNSETKKIWANTNATLRSQLEAQIVPIWKGASKFRVDKNEVLVVSVDMKGEDKLDNKASIRFLIIENDSQTKTKTGSIILVNSVNTLLPSEKIDLIIKHRSRKIDSFTGRVSIFDMGYKMIEYADYENGLQKKSGIVSSNPHKPYSSVEPESMSIQSTAGCVDWFLVTYLNGVEINSQYLGTTCSCEQTRKAAGARMLSDCGGGGGGSPSAGSVGPGIKAISSWTFPCGFTNDIYNRSANAHKEYFGVITADGRYLVTQEFSGATGGKIKGVAHYNGQAIYYWPVSMDANVTPYAGLIVINSDEGVPCYAIPIVATVHTHPCNDNDYCFLNDMSLEDKDLATDFSDIRHWAVGDGLVARFTPSGFFNVNVCDTLY